MDDLSWLSVIPVSFILIQRLITAYHYCLQQTDNHILEESLFYSELYATATLILQLSYSRHSEEQPSALQPLFPSDSNPRIIL